MNYINSTLRVGSKILLKVEDGMTISRLARKAKVVYCLAHSNCKNFEDGGLIEIGVKKHNKKCKSINLTEKGKEVKDLLKEIINLSNESNI